MNYPNLTFFGNFGEYIPTEIVDIYIEDQHHLASKKKKRDLNNYNKLMFRFKVKDKEGAGQVSFMWFQILAGFERTYGREKGKKLFLDMIYNFFNDSLLLNQRTLINTEDNKQLSFNFN